MKRRQRDLELAAIVKFASRARNIIRKGVQSLRGNRRLSGVDKFRTNAEGKNVNRLLSDVAGHGGIQRQARRMQQRYLHGEAEHGTRRLRQGLKIAGTAGAVGAGTGYISGRRQRKQVQLSFAPHSALNNRALELGAVNLIGNLLKRAPGALKSTYGAGANFLRKGSGPAKQLFNKASSAGRKAVKIARIGGRRLERATRPIRQAAAPYTNAIGAAGRFAGKTAMRGARIGGSIAKGAWKNASLIGAGAAGAAAGGAFMTQRHDDDFEQARPKRYRIQ